MFLGVFALLRRLFLIISGRPFLAIRAFILHAFLQHPVTLLVVERFVASSWATLCLLIHYTAVLCVCDRGSVVGHRSGASPLVSCKRILLLLRASLVALPALTLHELVHYIVVFVYTLVAHIGVAVRGRTSLGLESRPVEVLFMSRQLLE